VARVNRYNGYGFAKSLKKLRFLGFLKLCLCKIGDKTPVFHRK